MDWTLLRKVLHLYLFQFVSISMHKFVAFTLVDCCRICLELFKQLVTGGRLVRNSVSFFVFVEATVFEIFKSAVLWVVLKWHRRMKHLNHFTWFGELHRLLHIQLTFCEIIFFGYVGFNKSDSALENFAWILVVELMGISGYFNRWSQLVCLHKMMPAYRCWIRNIN